jgi:hypothetical protein
VRGPAGLEEDLMSDAVTRLADQVTDVRRVQLKEGDRLAVLLPADVALPDGPDGTKIIEDFHNWLCTAFDLTDELIVVMSGVEALTIIAAEERTCPSWRWARARRTSTTVTTRSAIRCARCAGRTPRRNRTARPAASS